MTDWTSDDWSTPPAIVQEYADRYGAFDLDPCARPETAKAPRYYTKADDGLAQPWHGRVWLNPPYSNPGAWLRKARAELASGRCDLVVALLPAATDTGWFHELIYDVSGRVVDGVLTIWAPRRGRIKLHGWLGTPIRSPKSGSIVVVYRRIQSYDERQAAAVLVTCAACGQGFHMTTPARLCAACATGLGLDSNVTTRDNT